MTSTQAEAGVGDDREDGEVACTEVQRALAVLGRSWAGAVLWSVLQGARRYGEVRTALPGISDAVLSARLKELCVHGLLRRTEDTGAVTYTPTPVGADAREALAAVRDLTRRHPRHFA